MHLIHEYGLLAVAAIIGPECLGLPVPGETALLAAAFMRRPNTISTLTP
jgi:membrane protein DedA with SNARE-associated domain